MKIAVVGSGIAGLGCAWALTRAGHEVHVLERDDRIGGHTHTVRAETPEGPVAVDTGFIVHNRENYPELVRLLAELGVDTCASDMSFAVHWPEGGGYDWCSRGLDGLLADRRNALRPGFWGLWREVARFNRAARRLAAEGDADLSLADFLRREGFSARFRDTYLVPMAGSVWSTESEGMDAFPALTLARFFDNHGMLGFTTQRPWRTLPGGTSRYLAPLTGPFAERIRTGVRIAAVRRTASGVTVEMEGQGTGAGTETFDQLVFACHGDQVLPMLPEATALERELLGAFTSTRNPTWLHTDAGVLPRHRRGWASWNVRADRRNGPLLATYHMNRLQPLATGRDLFVSLNAEDHVDEAKVLRKLTYEHPRYTREAVAAQTRWPELSGADRLHFAGAYWRYGFHEDGLWSGLRVARSLGAGW
ncbi:MAG TPA: FAD-dependent oxidoreductase [Holophagaceae bacterium]|nr:FAD-dependent oxidoreductase [Holophagaceae bacterium]